ncbi:hypothetical protein ACZ87_00761 [Candidatus Erwinia dacicola]|uniref:Uncharacterized protein n=1 Tax=Candidatus Erwinia dacicola TaxID=252393 RepID=A0A328TTK5_9GAMM|nr:hypothetical protein ACZ87_00761 [Candidatus Erwinia dacicola]
MKSQAILINLPLKSLSIFVVNLNQFNNNMSQPSGKEKTTITHNRKDFNETKNNKNRWL